MTANSLSELKNKSKEVLEFEEERKYDDIGSDSRFWKLTTDSKDIGKAIIRFLPKPKGEDKWNINYKQYSFQGPNGWYINLSRKMLGNEEPDPASELKSELYKKGKNGDEAAHARQQKMKLQQKWIMNILVIKDYDKPENDGKVFLYAAPKTILKKIQDAHDGDKYNEGFNPLDMWEGRDFVLQCKTGTNDFRTYEESHFESNASAVADNNDEIEKIWVSEHSLEGFLEPENFKSYDALKARLFSVFNMKEESQVEEQLKNASEEVNALDGNKTDTLIDDEIPTFTDDEKPSFDVEEKASDDTGETETAESEDEQTYDFTKLLNDD